MNLEWRTLIAINPRFWYLYQGSRCLGVVHPGTDGFDVYIESQTPFAQRTLVAKMPTLNEAKHLLQTLIGVQHA